MRRDLYIPSTSSFLSAEKDFELIINKMLENDKLKKLLFYGTEDCMERPSLTPKETMSLVNNQIRIIPKITVEKETPIYVIIGFDNFTTNVENPEFRDNVISFDIICHYDNWMLGDYQLRPYKIMGEIDGMLNRKHLSGIGTLQFLSGNQLLLGEKLGGYSIIYSAIHGREDVRVNYD